MCVLREYDLTDGCHALCSWGQSLLANFHVVGIDGMRMIYRLYLIDFIPVHTLVRKTVQRFDGEHAATVAPDEFV